MDPIEVLHRSGVSVLGQPWIVQGCILQRWILQKWTLQIWFRWLRQPRLLLDQEFLVHSRTMSMRARSFTAVGMYNQHRYNSYLQVYHHQWPADPAASGEPCRLAEAPIILFL
ncbi:hypothetical protein ABBQ38_002718 [Trebouxia sp. C0009 RCD-2024]